MKKCYLDANLLLYYSDPDSLFYSQATAIISQLLDEGWTLFLSSLTLDEYFHNMIRFSRVSREEAIKDLKGSFGKIIKLPDLQMITAGLQLKRQQKVINLMIKNQLRARDAYHLFIMLENKVKFMATFDNDFNKVFLSGKIKKFNPAPVDRKKL
ncbi:hypothetical protein A3H81_02480 [Candidatus Daviesbacteria bacterium RIFCSPLOWO2_02_FULL_38_18]|nr:MAG: hypothetical protein A3H81_02480 [Candidatus Daviesbacteria bacterium RIFCSPLOWO2_02_FULL_38_18]OGE72175.1 MAG: hypothetical protein A3H18_01635 [Candidatus Daviesbacteria bacterium RIFCSPLOWO2_12_FULL_38_10]